MCKLRPLLKEWLEEAEAMIENGATVVDILEAPSINSLQEQQQINGNNINEQQKQHQNNNNNSQVKHSFNIIIIDFFFKFISNKKI